MNGTDAFVMDIRRLRLCLPQLSVSTVCAQAINMQKFACFARNGSRLVIFA